MARRAHLRVRIRLGMFFLVIGALGVTGVAPAQQVMAQRELITQQELELATLTEQNNALESRLSRSADQGYMEKLAREQLGLVRPGETAYIVVPGPPVEAVPGPPEPKNLFEQVASWFRELF